MVVCPEGAEASWVSPKEGLCSVWPTAGALKSVFQRSKERKGQARGHRQGWGLQPLPQGLAGGAPAWGPLWEPPQYRRSSSSRFKVELIQRGQPSHLETQKELELALGGEEGQRRRSLPTGAFAPGSLASRGALPGTGCSPDRHHNGSKPNESSCLWYGLVQW